MPWSKENLPPAVKNKKWSKSQVKAFIKAANLALDQYKDDGKAIAVGIHAANNLNNSIVDGEAIFKKVPFIEAGLVNYSDLGLGTFLVRKETLDNMVKSLRGKPVIINHNFDINSEDIHGYVTNVLHNDTDGQYYAEFMLCTQEGKEAADELKFGSCSYTPQFSGKGGKWHANPYEDEITGGEFTHLALVDKPRYENAKILNNSLKENQMDDKTIIEKITELFNARFPSKIEAKDDHVIKIGEKELTVKEAKELVNAMDEKKKAKKDKKKAKKELKNKDKDHEIDDEETCDDKKDKKKAKKELKNSFSLDEDVIDKAKEMELFNDLNTAKDKAKEQAIELPEDRYMTEKAGYNLAKEMGI